MSQQGELNALRWLKVVETGQSYSTMSKAFKSRHGFFLIKAGFYWSINKLIHGKAKVKFVFFINVFRT